MSALALNVAAQDPQRPLVTKDDFLKELSKPLTRGISVGPPPSVTVTLYFKYDSTELADQASLKQLQEAAAAFKDAKLKTYSFQVEGHCDSDGEDIYNLILSQKRSAAIVRLLTERYGVAPDKLEPVGKGESQPIADNTTDEGKQKNRRVVFVRK